MTHKLLYFPVNVEHLEAKLAFTLFNASVLLKWELYWPLELPPKVLFGVVNAKYFSC